MENEVPKSEIRYSVWTFDRKRKCTLCALYKEHSQATAIKALKSVSGKGKFAYMTYYFKVKEKPAETYVLVSSLDNRFTLGDIRDQVYRLLRHRN